MPTAELTDRTVIALSGEQAAAFLQNVITADMDDIRRDGIGYGALLTPQGKIICDFLVHAGDDTIFIDVRKEAADTLIKRLTLYRLRAKVEIAGRPDLAVYAAWGDDAGPAGGARPDPRWAALGQRWIAPAGKKSSAAGEDWHAWRISHGVPEGGVDFLFDESFPHDAALDSLDGVAFDKGCFVGQEVVSRMRHRGTARRRIVLVEGDGPLPEAGTDIAAAGLPIGRLGSSSGNRGIAVVRLDRLEKARVAGSGIEAGGVPVQMVLPSWATYDWPSADSDPEAARS
jgi:folate-binding protein YgfZ